MGAANKLLVVEDEALTADLLRRYFEIVGYEVFTAVTGTAALALAKAEHPAVVILDIILPDMDGYEVCRRLRAELATEAIPIIFLTRKDERSDRIDGLELGAVDYITKPFNVEELRLKVHNLIQRMGGTLLVDPRTSLPNPQQLQERLPQLLEGPDSVFYLATIERLDAFSRRYGLVAANQVIRMAARTIADLLHELDPERSIIGHLKDDRFLVAAHEATAAELPAKLSERFAERAKGFYDYPDQERGHMLLEGKQIAFMALKIEQVSEDQVRAALGMRAPTQPAS